MQLKIVSTATTTLTTYVTISASMLGTTEVTTATVFSSNATFCGALVKLRPAAIRKPYKTMRATKTTSTSHNGNGTANSNEIEVFADFLGFNKLRHAIIVQDTQSESLNHSTLQATLGDFEALLENVRTTVFNIANSKADQFKDIFYAASPRLGILLPHFENIVVQKHILPEAAAVDLFNNSQAWLIMAQYANDNVWTLIKGTFNKLNININADITLAISCRKDNIYRLYDVYKICHKCGSPLNILEKGYWSKENGFILHAEFKKSFVRRRRNIQPIIKVGSLIREKSINVTNLEYISDTEYHKEHDTMQRKIFALMKMVEPMLNTSFDVLFTDTWGANVNGSWDGVIGQLVRNEIEFSVCPIRFTSERTLFITYSPELHIEYVNFIFRHPRRNVIRNIFFEPLADEVWWSVLAVTGLMILLLAIFVHHKQQQLEVKSNASIHVDIPIEKRLDFIIFIVLEAIFMQGPAPAIFHLISTRTLIITTCIFSVMLLQFYSAFIVGSLLATLPHSITTVEALYNSSLDIGMEDVVYNYELFANIRSPIAHEIYANRISKHSKGNIVTLERGVERIGRGGFAFYVGTNRAYRILKSTLNDAEFCELQEIQLSAPYLTSSALRKNSIYREHLANCILTFRTSGLMRYNEILWEIRKTDCNLEQNKDFEVDIEHFTPLLIFLGMAMLQSVIVLLIEMLWFRRKKMKSLIIGNT
ncbi:ionotropic receptor 75a [Teleopsis dalmanni]|uniref:ionotropic receptor 75a n=1 Tax=Teleopsis dalmanni TaxID=139649 RepID=UPI0018CDCD92|nr:ionotropic receptor 75a [Teleopsis dalmanni]